MDTLQTRRLQEEIKKKEPFKSPAQEAHLNLLRTGDLVHGRLSRVLRPYSLTISQYNILRILRGEGGPLPCLEIAHRLIMIVPAITGLLDKLETLGLVHRERSKGDRRVVYVSLTSQGTELLSQLDQPILDAHSQMCEHMTADELNTLSHLLEKARFGLVEIVHEED